MKKNNYDENILDAFRLDNKFSNIHQDEQKNIIKTRAKAIENFLASLLLDENIPKRLSEAMRYSLLAGGKRLRPMLCLSCAKICFSSKATNQDTWLKALPMATALEMIHTYSLIHDDLPAMDNDDLRRGKPTCHKAYDEGTAILAGDGLLSDAFYYMTLCDLNAQVVLKSIQLIALAIGSQNMVGGQMLDLEAENQKIDFESLKILNAKKTGALLRVSCELGAILSDVDAPMRKAIVSYGENLGIAFQIIDDVLDIVGDTAVLGKNVGSDMANNKSTWVSLMGLEESKKIAINYCDLAVKSLEELKNIENIDLFEIDFLQKIAQDMAYRVY